MLLPNEQGLGPILRGPETNEIHVTFKQVAAISAGLVIFWASLFHIAYFTSVGLEFITLTTSYDMLFSAGVILAPLFLYSAAIYHFYMFAILRRKVKRARIKRWVVPASFILPAIFAFVALCTTIVSVIFGASRLAVLVTHLSGLICAGSVAFLLSDFRQSNSVPLMMVIPSILIVSMSVWITGLILPPFTGKPCTVVATDQSSTDVQYLRGLGDGHLVKIGTRVRFIPSRRVAEIYCDPPPRRMRVWNM